MRAWARLCSQAEAFVCICDKYHYHMTWLVGFLGPKVIQNKSIIEQKYIEFNSLWAWSRAQPQSDVCSTEHDQEDADSVLCMVQQHPLVEKIQRGHVLIYGHSLLIG